MKDYSSYPDEYIVKLVKADQELYRELMSRYQSKLLRYARYLQLDENQAADIVQGAFIKAFIHLNSFDQRMKFSSWIYRIVHNETVNFIKKNTREVSLQDVIEITDSKDVEEDTAVERDRVRVRLCLSRLPTEYAEPLTLFFLEEKSYSEISDILRIPISTVGTRIRRAKLFMKKICQTNQ